MWQTGNDNLIWHLSCQQDDQIWRIEMNMPENCGFLHNWLVNLFTVRFLCLIVRPWDCPQNRETWEVCSWMGGGLSNALTNLCMALYCHENSVQTYRNKEQKIQWELNKAMHKFVRVLDEYGRGICMSLVWISSMVISILRSRPCSFARLVFTQCCNFV